MKSLRMFLSYGFLVMLLAAGHVLGGSNTPVTERLTVDSNTPHVILAGDNPIFLAGYYEAPDDAAPRFPGMNYFLDRNADYGCNTFRVLFGQEGNPYSALDPWDNNDCGQPNDAYYAEFLRPLLMYARDRGIYVVLSLYPADDDWSCTNKTDANRKKTYDKVLEYTWDLKNVIIETNWEASVHSNDFLYDVADYVQNRSTYPGVLAMVTDWHHHDLYPSPYSDYSYAPLGPNKINGRHRAWDRETSLAYWDENRPSLWTERWFQWPAASGGDNPMSEAEARVHLYRDALLCGTGIQFYYTRWNAPDHPELPSAYLQQCGYAVSLSKELPLADMAPEERLGSYTDNGYWFIALGKCYAGYLENGGDVTVDLSDAIGEIDYFWFNPRDGSKMEGTASGGGDRYFSAPDSNDWVLVIFPQPATPGDCNGDGKVDSADLALWQQNYDPLGENQNTFAMGDWDGNGLIDSADLALWQQNYDPIGFADVGAAHTPEPATLFVMTAAGLPLLLRRKRPVR